MRAEGGCHCGAVRYALSAAPTGSMICHCQTCRRITGAPVVAWLSVDPDALTFTKGKPQRYVSAPGRTRLLCGVCGTQLTWSRDDDASFIDVATASLDDPSAFPPTHHSWTSHDVAWVKFGDALPTFAKGPLRLILVIPDAERDPEPRGKRRACRSWVPGSMLRIAPE